MTWYSQKIVCVVCGYRGTWSGMIPFESAKEKLECPQCGGKLELNLKEKGEEVKKMDEEYHDMLSIERLKDGKFTVTSTLAEIICSDFNELKELLTKRWGGNGKKE
jgi:transcription elongation factor Elf1